MNPSTTPSPDKKYTKPEVRFEHPANGRDRCSDCIHYLPDTRSCKIVRGHIEPGDWCNKFKRK